MPGWKRRLLRAGYRLDAWFGRRRPPAPHGARIVAYRGFGTAGAVHVRGRVLRNAPPLAADARASWWDNLKATGRRFRTDELPGVAVRASLAGATATAVTDAEGYFALRLAPPAPLSPGWHDVTLALPDAVPPAYATGRVLVPPPEPPLLFVSDIDDTLLQTHATRRLKMLRVTLFHNARTRRPFPGAAALYRALGGPTHHPFFYVSNGPWNLYDFLVEFMDLHGFPEGPLFLRDFGFDEEGLTPFTPDAHKQHCITTLLKTYPTAAVVLFGDNGEADPAIYAGLIEAFPDRIRAAYLRDVRGADDAPTAAAVARAAACGVPMVRVSGTAAAARHAATLGLLSGEALAPVLAACRAEGDPSA